MKMVMISADDYEKLSNAKKESETKIESYKQCIAGYESRIKELTEERDKLKDVSFDMYKKLTADNKRLAKTVLNSAYGVEQDICCRISNNLNRSMFDKISQLSDENEKLKKESAEKSEWLKAKNEALDNLIIGYNKLEKEYKELENDTVSVDLYKQKIKDNEYLAAENSRLANDQEIIRLNNELKILKKQYVDLNNAYKSQKNELLKLKNKPYDDLKHELEDTACKVARIYNNANESHNILETLAYDLKDYM